MTHALSLLHKGGHLYGPGGIGAREYDIAPHLISEVVTQTRDLPGFIERGTDGGAGVTYESHHFWVHFLNYGRKPEGRHSGVIIRVCHGGGWEVWRGDYMLADALSRYGDDARGLFKLCWYMIDNAHYSRLAGRDECAREFRQAFVDGRLKKRKLPAQGKVKVWIEPPKEASADAA